MPTKDHSVNETGYWRPLNINGRMIAWAVGSRDLATGTYLPPNDGQPYMGYDECAEVVKNFMPRL